MLPLPPGRSRPRRARRDAGPPRPADRAASAVAASARQEDAATKARRPKRAAAAKTRRRRRRLRPRQAATKAAAKKAAPAARPRHEGAPRRRLRRPRRPRSPRRHGCQPRRRTRPRRTGQGRSGEEGAPPRPLRPRRQRRPAKKARRQEGRRPRRPPPRRRPRGSPAHVLALIYDLAEDYLERRGPLREEHLGLARAAHRPRRACPGRGVQRSVRPRAAGLDDRRRVGGDALRRGRPYVANGLVTGWQIRTWNVVVGRSRAARPS